MKEFLSVAAIQADIFWEQKEANLASFEEKMATLEDVDIIFLPETFNTGFSMNDSVAEVPNFLTHKWMHQMASSTGAVVVGSYIVKEKTGCYNRLIWMRPDGTNSHYDKRHLFILSDEYQKLQSGKKILIEEVHGWKICPLICYDLRFPVWSRNERLKYDLLAYIANWPDKRVTQWEIMLQSRAIENQAYTIGLNRVGDDGNNIHYNGSSMAVSYDGTTMKKIGEREDVLVVEFSAKSLIEYRKKFPVHLSSDSFKITN